MSELAKKHRDRLPTIKKNVHQSSLYWQENSRRYDEYRRLVFVSSLDERMLASLRANDRPTIEFNILEASVSRLRGEFSKQEPEIEVSSKEGVEEDQQQADMIKIVEDHMRYVLAESKKLGLEYHCYTDTLSGGFSVMKCYTDYASPMSFNHEIRLERVFDPCLCGFDPMANLEDKSDGGYCFENYPMRREDFEQMYPDVSLGTMSFARSFDGFNWSYQTGQEDILIVCDYYEKKKRIKTIQLYTDGVTRTKEDYESFIEEWNTSGNIEQPPQPVGQPRKTELTTICRYKVIENQVLEYVETDYTRFPLIFIDGNSVLTKNGDNTAVKQMTRPYVYNAVGAQRLKNFAGQSLANELENLIQGQWIVAEGSVKSAYADAYKNPQRASTFIYSPYKNDDPNVPLPRPEVVQRAEIPRSISDAFQMSDQIVQATLGSFDASIAKMNTHEVSGVAIQETLTLGNSAAMPYVVSFLRGLQSAAQSILELIPLYYTTPMTIPIMDAQGKRSYVKINQEGGVSFDYDKDAIQVRVEAGASFGVQQSRALNQIIALMNSSEMFAKFVNEVGLGIILDNVEIRGITQLRVMADEWMMQQQEMAMQQAQQQQMMAEAEASKPNLEQMALDIAARQVEAETLAAQEKIDLEQRKLRTSTLLDIGQLRLDQQKAQTDLLQVLAKKEESDEKHRIQRTKDEVAAIAKATEFALKTVEMDHARKDRSADRAVKFHTAKFPKKRDRLKQEQENNERQNGKDGRNEQESRD